MEISTKTLNFYHIGVYFDEDYYEEGHDKENAWRVYVPLCYEHGKTLVVFDCTTDNAGAEWMTLTDAINHAFDCRSKATDAPLQKLPIVVLNDDGWYKVESDADKVEVVLKLL